MSPDTRHPLGKMHMDELNGQFSSGLFLYSRETKFVRMDEKMVIFSDRNITKGISDHFPKKNSIFQLFNGKMSILDQIYKKNDFQMSFF